jgi:protein-S-isoprenylcysteine O-methyltransferase Ste14
LSNPDLLIYFAHIGFWATFGLTRLFLHKSPIPAESAPELAATSQEYTAPFSRTVLAFHMFGFAVLYFGIANAVLPKRVPERFPAQRLIGAATIAVGAFLISWAITSFHLWRFRAKLERGHQLATNGAFRVLRHPIYSAMNLLALGTAVWIPTAITTAGFILIVVGSVLRARSEETLLRRAFGAEYVEYSRRTKRFIPGVY